MESQLSQRSATLEQIEQMEKEFQATQLRTMDVTIATLPNLNTFIDLHGLDMFGSMLFDWFLRCF